MPSLGEKFRPSDSRLAELEKRGRRAVEELRAGGYDVAGDLSALEPRDVRDRRQPGDVTDAELLDASVQVTAALMYRVRALTQERNALVRTQQEATSRVSVPRFVARWVSRIRKDSTQ